MIERDEVKRLLAALLQENPAIDLDDEEIDDIVDQASGYARAPSSSSCKTKSRLIDPATSRIVVKAITQISPCDPCPI